MTDKIDEAEESRAQPQLDDKPPLLGSWRNIYAVVLGTLVVVIVLFTAITKVYQ